MLRIEDMAFGRFSLVRQTLTRSVRSGMSSSRDRGPKGSSRRSYMIPYWYMRLVSMTFRTTAR